MKDQDVKILRYQEFFLASHFLPWNIVSTPNTSRQATYIALPPHPPLHFTSGPGYGSAPAGFIAAEANPDTAGERFLRGLADLTGGSYQRYTPDIVKGMSALQGAGWIIRFSWCFWSWNH